LPAKDQYRAGRYELMTTPFDVFERNLRDQLGRMLGAGGFESARDIQAITVNRWPHGYAYEYNPLFEPLDRPDSERPCVIGRQPFGRIHIANSDADGHAYTNIAIDQGYRAVRELTLGGSMKLQVLAPDPFAFPAHDSHRLNHRKCGHSRLLPVPPWVRALCSRTSWSQCRSMRNCRRHKQPLGELRDENSWLDALKSWTTRVHRVC
jgi:hypothetical protein